MAFTLPTSWRRGVAALALLVSGCAGPRLYYDNTVVHTEAVESEQRSVLLRQLQAQLGSRPLRQRQAGQWQQLQPSGPGVEALSLPAARALYALMDEDYFGAEADILIRLEGAAPQAVQLRVDTQGGVEVWSAGMGVMTAELPEGFFASRGIGPLQEAGRPWQALELQAVAMAIDKLSRPELALLQNIAIVRAPLSEETGEGGRYHQKNCKAVIYVYDRAFLGRNVQFVGSPEAPLPAAVLTLLHELGHALHNRPSRLTLCRYEQTLARRNALVPQLNRAVRGYNQRVVAFNRGQQDGGSRAQMDRLEGEIGQLRRSLQRLDEQSTELAEQAAELLEQGPVLEAYEEALDGEAAPTHYGESHIKESFAESFALFRGDPEALQRVLPRVYAWFQSGGHLRALQAPPDS